MAAVAMAMDHVTNIFYTYLEREMFNWRYVVKANYLKKNFNVQCRLWPLYLEDTTLKSSTRVQFVTLLSLLYMYIVCAL